MTAEPELSLPQRVSLAVDNDEMFLEYLPIVELTTPYICAGAEALVRWRRDSVVIPPNDFIPLIENTPASGLLTYWVIDRVARDLLEWLRGEGPYISINIPPEVLGRSGVRYVARKAHLFEVRHRIVWEITERGFPDQLGLSEMEWAAQRGSRLALDDVGLGEANLVALTRVPVEILKVDRSVTAKLPDPDVMRWLSNLVRLSRDSDKIIVAEGIETEEQRRLCEDVGIALGQGWLFSRPLELKELMRFAAAPDAR